MNDLLTWATLLLLVYAVLRKIGVLRAPFPARALAGRVKTLATAIPWTPPQAAARQQTPPRGIVRSNAIRQAEHRYRMERLSRSRTTVPPVPVSPVPAQTVVMSHAARRSEPLTDMQRERVRELLGLGWSNNKVYSLILGSRGPRMAEIEAVRAELDAEQLAKVLAKPDVQVPAMEAVPT